MSLLEGLRFTRGDSLIHRLDPRVKFIMTMAIFTSAILFMDLLPLLIIFLVQIPLIFIAEIQQEWTKSMKGSVFLATIIFSTNLISYYFFQGRSLNTENVETALALTVRFLNLITSFSLFFLTTSPDKLSLALEKARIPYEFNFAQRSGNTSQFYCHLSSTQLEGAWIWQRRWNQGPSGRRGIARTYLSS
jgi:energy-coupling factor transport system permease protein